jgi:hypothetical protein
MAALLGHKAEAIPLGLEDPPFIVEGFLDECREHRLISGIHAFSFARVCGFQRSQQGLAAGSAACGRSVVARDWFALCSLTFQSCATPRCWAGRSARPVRCGRGRESRRTVLRLTKAEGSGGPSFQGTIKRASKTTAMIRSSKKAAKITVSRMVPQSDLGSDALSPRATPSPIAPILLRFPGDGRTSSQQSQSQ